VDAAGLNAVRHPHPHVPLTTYWIDSMALSKLARRLLSLTEAREFWAATPSAKLSVEQMEDRTTPAVTAAVAGGVLTLINNDAANEGVTIDTTTNAGFITVLKGATATNNVTAGAGTVATGTGAKVAVAGITTISVINAGGAASTKFTDVTVNNIAGATDLRAFNYVGGTSNDDVVLTAGGNANVYYKVDVGGGSNTFKASDAGVNVLSFSDSAAAANVTVTPSAANSKTALSFKNVTAPVSANLTVGGGGSLASYTNMNVTLAAAGDATKVVGVYGGKGSDTLIGNAVGNVLIGGDGDDTLVGNGGDDQLNANRDFSPSMPGPVNTGGVAVTGATTVIDVSQFAAINTAFAGVPNQSATAAALFAQFGFLSFGEGVAALGGAGGLNGTSLGVDFTTANGLTATASNDTLVGGDGNDGHYGFNNARVSATGGIGNDVFSTNVNGLASTYDGGDGNDLLIGGAGFTLLGGANDDNLSFAVADPNATQPSQSTANGGPGNDTISAAFRNVTIDAGENTDTLTLGNFPDIVVVLNGTTGITNGLPAIPNVRLVSR
jgi:hypothetical protein